MKVWDWFGIIGSAAVIYLVAENNIHQIKRTISNHLPLQPSIIPVSTTEPGSIIPVSTTEPPYRPGSKAGCPPGMYEDWTDGILRCHDAGGTRELNPNVKKLIPDQKYAFGKTIDNNYWDYGGQYEDGWGYATPQQQRDELKRLPSLETILPPSQANIKKTQEKKKKKSHKKLAEIPQKPGEIHTQIECSDNLPCGSNCWKDGKLWKIVCSEKERESLYPSRRKTKSSITIPPGFPGTVTVTPSSPSEEPYPEETDQNQTLPEDVEGTIGGTSPTRVPQGDVPIQIPPDQQQIFPTIPETTPGRGPTSTTPPQVITPSGRSFKPGGKEDCHLGNLSSGKRDTCRWNFDVTSQVGDNDYMIDCDVTLGSRSTDTEWPHDTPRVEITSGGPGSTAQNCCGFTASVNIPGGELHMESEDWSKSKGKVGHSTGQTYLDKGPSISGGQDLFNKTVHIRWMYQTDSQNNTYYTAAAWLKGQQPVSRTVTNISSPGLNGKKLILGKFAPGAKIANDPSRVRVDSAGLQIDFHGGPTVTILGKNTYRSTNYYHHKPSDGYYQSNLGYISDGYYQSDLGYISNSNYEGQLCG